RRAGAAAVHRGLAGERRARARRVRADDDVGAAIAVHVARAAAAPGARAVGPGKLVQLVRVAAGEHVGAAAERAGAEIRGVADVEIRPAVAVDVAGAGDEEPAEVHAGRARRQRAEQELVGAAGVDVGEAGADRAGVARADDEVAAP